MPISAAPRQLLLAAAVSFALTLAAAALLVQSGWAVRALGFLERNVDAGVLLLFVPLCALVFALAVEVIRTAARESLPETIARTPRLAWAEGR